MKTSGYPKLFGDEVRLADEVVDYDTSGEKRFYVLKERCEGRNERIRLKNISAKLPLREIRWNQAANLNKDPVFVEAEGSFFPDFLEENGVYLVSLRFYEKYKELLGLETITYNSIGVLTEEGKRMEDYFLIVPEEIDCILTGNLAHM